VLFSWSMMSVMSYLVWCLVKITVLGAGVLIFVLIGVLISMLLWSFDDVVYGDACCPNLELSGFWMGYCDGNDVRSFLVRVRNCLRVCRLVFFFFIWFAR